jgi:hypothetical protein
MFARGSRYRNLPDAVAHDPAGVFVRGKGLRRVPPASALLSGPAQAVTHTVLAGDRLDLLAFKYYGDSTRWWQIADANAQPPFPTDLLAEGPVVREHLALAHGGFLTRLQSLTAALGALGTVRPRVVTSFDGDRTPEPSFVEETVVVAYAPGPAARPALLAELAAHGFRLLRAFAWTEGPATVEAFTFDDPDAKDAWRRLLDGLAALAGVAELRPDTAELRLLVAYHAALVRRESLFAFAAAQGFTAEAWTESRVGARILVPPMEIV